MNHHHHHRGDTTVAHDAAAADESEQHSSRQQQQQQGRRQRRRLIRQHQQTTTTTRRFVQQQQPQHTLLQLPVGDVNIVVVTDVHGWVAGHQTITTNDNYHDNNSTGSRSRRTADYGDIVSFYRRLQEQFAVASAFDVHDGENEPTALLFVMNGDFMDGTGLSTVPPTHLLPLLRRMPWDAINVGNHELYQNGALLLFD